MKKGLLYKLEVFISSERGQRFFNFAYSIGAAVVIWGALFKILHLPGGDMLLTIGMGTEVVMFFLTAFDRPPVNNNVGYTTSDTIPAETTLHNPSGLAEETKGVITEMAKLRETTNALNKLYELQLKNLSSNLNTIESGNRDALQMREILNRSVTESQRYCDETVKMAENMAQLNAIYDRMISAMSSGKAMPVN